MNLRPGQTYTARDLEDLPTLHQGQCCDCKLEDSTTRIWLCRVENGVTIEALVAGRWVTIAGDDYAESATLPE